MKKLFEKGNPGKKKGTRNKLPRTVQVFINDILTGNYETFEDKMSELADKKPYEYCKIYLELLSYVVPKLRAVEISTDAISLLSESQAKQICQDVARQALYKIHGDKIPESLRVKYGD